MRSTTLARLKRDIKIGICAACHPFFTGEQKFVDTAGRVEKFARRYGSTKATRAGEERLDCVVEAFAVGERPCSAADTAAATSSWTLIF